MKFEIRQFNSDNHGNKDEVLVFREAFINFMPEDQHSLIEPFLQREINYYENTQIPLQYFYIICTETGDIAASFGLIIRDSTIPDKNNIVVTAVNTSRKFRKQRLMEKLLKFSIALYEDNGFEEVKDYFRYSDDFINESKKFIISHVHEGSFWTLYSAVSDYYSRFGFVSVKSLNYYTSQCSEMYSDNYPEKFVLEDGEQFLTTKNVMEYLTGDKYIPSSAELSSESTRCCSFKTGSIPRFINGDKYYFNTAHSVNIPHAGLILKSKTNTTVFCITHCFSPTRFMIRRLYTDVTDKLIFNNQLERIYEYIIWYINSFSIDKLDNTILFSEGDIISSDTTKNQILQYFGDKNWKWDETNIRWVPMLKEWKCQKPTGDWLYNGFWCYT